MAGLLFLAFAYFAVGQAAVNRNGAQTAADAAALAAAQETRDRLADRWTLDVLDPTQWQDIFDGVGATTECGEAARLAALNDAGDVRCDRIGLRYDVTVQANKSAGKSVIPATSVTQAHASATAVIESLCTFEPAPEESGDPGNTGEPEDPGDPEDPDDPQDVVLPRLTCKDGRIWDLDPADLTDLPGPEDLFDVHLATG